MNLKLAEARRAPGSEWMKDHPRALEILYRLTERAFVALYPGAKRLAPAFTERFMIRGEKLLKGYMFNCQMCGQCVLHSTGMTCPMNCPKHLRNGPCGGVRLNGNCEVLPDRKCVWVQAWERSQNMRAYKDDMRMIQPPVNHALKNTSSWINRFENTDRVKFPEPQR